MVLGGDCFRAGFSFSSPRAPFLVLEEGAGLTRSPWGFIQPFLPQKPP